MKDIDKQVLHIVETLENGCTYSDAGMDAEEYNAKESDIISGFDYLQDVLDIEYITDSKKEYLGARVLVSFGGPNIWINTRTKQVEGYWWQDSSVKSYHEDAMGIDESLEELFNCI